MIGQVKKTFKMKYATPVAEFIIALLQPCTEHWLILKFPLKAGKSVELENGVRFFHSFRQEQAACVNIYVILVSRFPQR